MLERILLRRKARFFQDQDVVDAILQAEDLVTRFSENFTTVFLDLYVVYILGEGPLIIEPHYIFEGCTSEGYTIEQMECFLEDDSTTY